MDLPLEQFALRLALALVLGAVIGVERQWRQRPWARCARPGCGPWP